MTVSLRPETAPAPPSAPGQALETRLRSMVRAARDGDAPDMSAVRAAAEEFESVFLASVFETLYQGIRTDGPFGGGQGEAMFRSLLTQEHAKAMTARGGIGLADRIVAELQRHQEV